MVKRVDLQKSLNLTSGIINRICRDIQIKQFKHEDRIYLDDKDAERLKEHIHKYEPYLLKRIPSNKFNTNELKVRLVELEEQQLNGDGSIELMREIHQLRLKLKHRTGNSNIMCVSVNDTNAMR